MQCKKSNCANLFHDSLNKLYREMLRIRRIEEAIAERYPEQKMRCPVHLSIGQEAIAVGVCSLLCRSDKVFSNHRAHAHFLAKGGNLKKMIAEIYGKEAGCCGGYGGSMHLVDLEAGFLGSTPIVGGTIPLAVGSAFASWYNEEEVVTAVFFGEGATEEGVFAESLNFASLKKLPILFICENNLYSVYSPLSVRQPSSRSRVGFAEAHGILSIQGDGNNLEEVVALTERGLENIRSGKGPAFLEFSTYRFREHCGPNVDTHLGYRSEEEYNYWVEKDPLKEVTMESEEKEIEKEIQEAFAYAVSMC